MIRNVLKRTAGTVAGLLLLLAVFGLGAAGEAQAQALKVGYTDHEVILVNMKEYQNVQQQMQQYVQGGQAELQKLYQDYQEKVDRYQKQQALLSDQKKQEREQELMQIQQQIQQTAATKDQELAQRQAQLLQPLLEKVQTAIDKIAKQKKLDVVLRSQVGGEPVLLYVNEQTVVNITLDVARELGIEVDEEQVSN